MRLVTLSRPAKSLMRSCFLETSAPRLPRMLDLRLRLALQRSSAKNQQRLSLRCGVKASYGRHCVQSAPPNLLPCLSLLEPRSHACSPLQGSSGRTQVLLPACLLQGEMQSSRQMPARLFSSELPAAQAKPRSCSHDRRSRVVSSGSCADQAFFRTRTRTIACKKYSSVCWESTLPPGVTDLAILTAWHKPTSGNRFGGGMLWPMATRPSCGHVRKQMYIFLCTC